MSSKIYHWTSTFKSLGENEDGGVDIKGSASTNALDRAGDIIESDAWTKGGGKPVVINRSMNMICVDPLQRA